MVVQLTYADTPAIAFNGMLAEQCSLRQVDSGLVETAILGLGIAVKHGTADGQYVACIADDAVVGVSLYAVQDVESQTVFQYAIGASFPVLVKGRYYAIANAAIAPEAATAFDPATGKVGAVVGATTTLAFGVAKSTAAADGDLIIIEVNF